MEIKLNDGASAALQALFWATACAACVCALANCNARVAEAAKPELKVQGNTVITTK